MPEATITVLLLLSRILIFLYDIFEFRAVTPSVPGHLDLCEMRCYVAVRRYELAIDLEPEMSVEVAPFPASH